MRVYKEGLMRHIDTDRGCADFELEPPSPALLHYVSNMYIMLDYCCKEVSVTM